MNMNDLLATGGRINFAPDGGGAMTQQQRQMAAMQANLNARQACVRQGVDMIQSIFTGTFTNYVAGTPIVLNIPLRNVGLVKRLIVRVNATVSGSAGPTHTLQPLGPANFFSQIVFTDLSNQQRINTPGWHLMAVATAKRKRVYGAAFTSDTPFGYGNNFPKVMAAPATITAAAATNNVFAFFEIPMAYTDQDLRGSVYANVTNATMQIQLTVNPSLLVPNTTTDPTLSMYQSSTGVVATMPSFTVTVYQNYLDQLPIAQNGGPVLPLLDLSTAYLLNNTPVSGLAANQDNPIPYSNFRDFMSTCLIYDNAGVLGTGDDINNLAITSANFTNIVKFDPYTADLLARLILGDDPPKGMYYFDHRQKPISTIQYGNMQLIVNPITVTAGASFLVGYESLALINMITQAGSLYGS